MKKLEIKKENETNNNNKKQQHLKTQPIVASHKKKKKNRNVKTGEGGESLKYGGMKGPQGENMVCMHVC
jgi:hypothetical protein